MSASRVGAFALWLVACTPQAPRLDAIRPDAGEAAGGAKVRLEGAGFVGHGRAVVYLGQRSARAVVIEDDRLITIMTPEAEALGAADLRLQFADGTVLERAGGYTYSGELKPLPFVPGQRPLAEE